MKKQILKSALMAVVGVGLLAGGAMAMQIDFLTDEGNTASFTSGTGFLSNNTTVGDYFVSVNGISQPTLTGGPLQLSMTNFDIVTSADTTLGDFLKITITDTYTGSYPGFLSAINATSNTFATADYSVTITKPDSTFITSSLSGLTGLFNDTLSINTPGNLSGTWTIKMTATLFGDNETANFDATTTAVPEPATMLLFGAGVAGLAGIARRKKTVLA